MCGGVTSTKAHSHEWSSMYWSLSSYILHSLHGQGVSVARLDLHVKGAQDVDINNLTVFSYGLQHPYKHSWSDRENDVLHSHVG